MSEAPTLAHFRAAKDALAAHLLRAERTGVRVPSPHPLDNVVGVGLGEQVSAGRPTGRRALTILVADKFPPAEIASADRLPASFAGLPVDVQEVGLLHALGDRRPQPRARTRPLRPGCSIGFESRASAATLGAFVRAGSRIFALTAGHDHGELLCQPARLDGGRPGADRIGTLERALVDVADCAIARLDDGIAIDPAAQPARVGEASADALVSTVGRSSGHTTGRIASIDTDVKVDYGDRAVLFRRQIVVAGRLRPGDSGAVLAERESGRAVGLVFAGSGAIAVASHLTDVLALLGVSWVGEDEQEPAAPAPALTTAADANGDAPVLYTRLAP